MILGGPAAAWRPSGAAARPSPPIAFGPVRSRRLGSSLGSYRTLGYGMVPLGALLGGAIGEAFGLRAALAVGAIGIAAAPLWIVCSPAPSTRRLDDVPPIGDGASSSSAAEPLASQPLASP